MNFGCNFFVFNFPARFSFSIFCLRLYHIIFGLSSLI
nr:MAG TPA: hypothetical protein [Caudoviricetes sp.]